MSGFQTTFGVRVRHLHAVAQEDILLEVGLQRRLGSVHLDDFAKRVFIGSVGQSGIVLFERLPQVAREHDFLFIHPPKCPVRPESLGVVGIDRFPAELPFQIFSSGLLY